MIMKKRISKRIKIRVKNVNEPPTFRKVYFKTKQNAKDRFDMGISDPEGKTLSYRLSGADKSYFWISKSGILRYRGGDPGVLASRTFRLKVTASDGAKSKTRLIRVKHRVPNAVKACIFGIGTFNNCTFGI